MPSKSHSPLTTHTPLKPAQCGLLYAAMEAWMDIPTFVKNEQGLYHVQGCVKPEAVSYTHLTLPTKA